MDRWIKVALSAAVVMSVAGCTTYRLAAPNGPPPPEPIGMQLAVPASTAPDRFANVCHIQTTRVRPFRPDKISNGSAVLYRGRYLITAAHNVYSPFYNRVTRIEVHCGVRNVEGTPANFVLTGKEWASAQGYFWKRYTHDLGVIRLPGVIVPTDAVALAAAAPEPGTTVEIAGYPGGTINRRDTNILYSGSGQLVEISDDRLIGYRIDTTTGNSGGPVWQRVDDRQSLFGIHVVGFSGGGGARRVDDWFRREVDRMIAALDAEAAS